MAESIDTLSFILKFIKENRNKLSNYEIIKEVFKESGGIITISFEELRDILVSQNLSLIKSKHYRESLLFLKSYIKNNEFKRRILWEESQEKRKT
jgi:hypothetical protein